MLRTALYDSHVAAGARMVPFAGWEMPVQYQGVIAETRAVRSDVGIFDVSHMGRLSIQGSGAASFLDTLVTFSVKTLAVGRARYGFILTDDGGVLDDVILYHTQVTDGSDLLRLVCNAANRNAVTAWMERHMTAFPGVSMSDHTSETVLVAMQGPSALEIMDGLCLDEPKPSALRPFAADTFPMALGSTVSEAFVGRTGYTGEDGVEVAMDAAHGPQLWAALTAAGAAPCGLGARDVLRLEAGLRLHGADMDVTRSPLEAGLERFVNMDKGLFHGRDALELQEEEGPPSQRLAGFRLLGGGVPRHGCPILQQGTVIGEVTSGTYSPILDTGIAMGYVANEHTTPGNLVHIDMRGRLVEAEVAELPFYRRPVSWHSEQTQ